MRTPKQRLTYGNCSVEGCDKQAEIKGPKLCRTHYGRLRSKGALDDPPERSEIIRRNWDGRYPPSIEEYLRSKINILEDENECWEAKKGRKGWYTEGQYKNDIFLLHRKMYEIYNGEIPENLVVRHKCDNTLCCNPNHLELGTKKDNRRDFMERHPRAKELIEELTARGRKAVTGFWNSMNEEERADFVKRRAERQAEIRRERLSK